MRTLRVLLWIMGGAVVLGFIGFVGGFYGPLILTPEANQGPLLGIFITGPLGILIGGVLGGLIGGWMERRRDKNETTSTPSREA